MREKRGLKERRSTKRKKDEGTERVDASARQTMQKGKKRGEQSEREREWKR